MRVKSFLKSSLISISLIIFATISLSAQNFTIQKISIDDSITLITCGYNGSSPYLDKQMKGNSDGGLSPGERVQVYITVKNQTGYDITYMYGIMSPIDPTYLNVISPNCYGSGGWGVRYQDEVGGDAVIANGDTRVNSDPYVVEVKQDIPCGQYVDFMVSFFYKISGDTFLYSDTRYFSLPIFSLDSFSLKPEAEIFQSSYVRRFTASATNTRNIGIFYGQSITDAGTYFAELNLDGVVTKGPIQIYNTTFNSYNETRCTALWNDYAQKYALFVPGVTAGLHVISAGDDPVDVDLGSMGTAYSVSSSCYDRDSFSSDNIVVFVKGGDGKAYLARLNASTYGLNTLPDGKGYAELSKPDSGCTIYNSSLCYMPASGSTPPYYFVAVEYHGVQNVLRVYKVNALNFNDVTFYAGGIAIGSDVDKPAAPTIAIDPNPVLVDATEPTPDYFTRRVIVGYSKTGTHANTSWPYDIVPDAENSILATVFQESLMPFFTDKHMTVHNQTLPVQYGSDSPQLTFSCGKFYLMNREKRLSSSSGRVQLGVYDLEKSWGTDWTPDSSEFASAEWVNQKDLACLAVTDKCYLFWDDSRGDALETTRSLHYSEARCLDNLAPYNTNVNDDVIISQPYEWSSHPSIACRKNDCLVAWQKGTDGGTYNIYASVFPIDGPVSQEPQFSTSGYTAPLEARPLVRVFRDTYGYSEEYKIYWRDNYPGDIMKHTYGSGSPAQISVLAQGTGEFLDAVPMSSGTDLILTKDCRGTGCLFSLWATKSFGSPYAVIEHNLTEYLVSTDELVSAKVALISGVEVPGAGGPYYPFAAVAWLEKQLAAPTQTRLKFAYLLDDATLSFVPGYPKTLMIWDTSSTTVNDFSMAANENLVSVLAASKQSDGISKLVLFNYSHPIRSLIDVNPETLPDGTLWDSYNQQISASGGTGPYSFSVTSGSLPSNLTLSSGGILSGSLMVEGTFAFTVSAIDAMGRVGQREYSLFVNPIGMGPSNLPGGTLYTYYNQQIWAWGGTYPFTFAVTSSELPSGLSLSSDGYITGYPTTEGTYAFTVTATDADSRTAQRAYSIQISYMAMGDQPDQEYTTAGDYLSSDRAEVGGLGNSTAVLRETYFYGTGNAFNYPRINWNGKNFDYSWTEEGSNFLASPFERLFFVSRLDECGGQIAWPVRVSSPISGTYASELNYGYVSTRKGAVAVYFQAAGQLGTNIYATALSWDDSAATCSIYNVAPVVSTTGPYIIEYGSGVTLSGTATDDIALGDILNPIGWDITNDGMLDYSGAEVVLTFDNLRQKGLAIPRSQSYPLLFKATDRQGLSSSGSGGVTSLSIYDTTPPNVTVTYPNGGETLRVGGNYTIMWTGSDNYQLDYFNVYYCTDWAGDPETATWVKINTSSIPGTQFFYDWTIPDFLSSTCRIKVEAFDKGVPSVKTNSDYSDENFYMVQATTSSIKTLILRSQTRMEANYSPELEDLVDQKLLQLMVNGKVNGFIVEVDSIPGLSGPTGLYKAWDDDATSIDKANAVANTIRDYVKNLVRTDYTNVEYLVIVGDDRIIPFYRIEDATPGTYSEDHYDDTTGVDCATTTGSAICKDYYLTDNIYGDIGYWNGDAWEEYETTTEGSNFMALPDLAIGRLVETPEQIATTIDAFITMDGQVTLNSLTTANVFVSGYDFLTDSATAINNKYDTPYMVDNLLGGACTHDQLETALFVGLQTPTPSPYVLNSLNGHCTHYTLETPSGGPLPTTEMNIDYPGESLKGRIFYSVGCHSGLNVPSSFTNNYDLPEMMMEKGAVAYVGNTGYGWGLKHGIGYTEKLMEMITDKMLLQQMVSLGQALSQAKREYFIQDKRYDVFDEKVLFESTLYGLPMYRIVMSQSSIAAPKDFSGAAGPDHEEVNGITLDKKLIKADKSNLLPTGVTELALNFEFGPGTHQLVDTADGDYYKLNGRMNGEAGDSLQPLFIYESRLSGVVSHGVIFTGGTFTNYADFDPVIAAPESSSPLVPPEPIAPIGSAFIPTINVAHPQLPSSLVSTDLTKLTVYTGYFNKYSGETSLGTETLFNTVGFSVYYSNSSDKTAPSFPSPPAEGGDYHTLTGTNCAFSVQASDAGTGLYRVLVTYSDNLSSWQSLDLVYNGSSSRWEGTLTLSKSITYFVQAVDNAGNCKVLKSNEGMSGLDPNGLPYVVGARLFEVQFLDSDSDGMPNDWETANGTNPNVADANEDPDDDGMTNIQEMNNHTNPLDDDTDNDGMEDGWEVAKGLNPLANDAGLDPDHDSLTNLDEYAANTNPYDADTDDDSMPDGWEVTYGLNPLVIDDAADGDHDGLDNGEEYAASTKPTVDDTDGDGDNDGSEANNGRNPLSAGDGKRITIFESLDGDDVVINWPSGSGDNGVIDGSYWIYRSTVPYHGAADEMVTMPLPLEDGTTTYRDVGAAGGTETYFYTVTNSRFTAPAPTIGAIVPSSGPVGSTINIYGTNFVTGAVVRIGGITAGSIVVQNASLITCTAPANSLGAKDVTITNPNGQFVTKTGGFTYTP